MSAATGVVSGTPAAATNGGQNFGVTMKDSSGNSTLQNCNLNVGNAQQTQMTGTDDQYGHGTHIAPATNNCTGGPMDRSRGLRRSVS
jgi:hypothetical protein